MTSLNDKIKIIFEGKQLQENRFDIGTTKDSIDLDIIIKNISDVLLKNLKFHFPMGIDVLEPKMLPDRMVPELEIPFSLRIDTSLTRTFTMEVEGSFLHVLAR